VVTGLPVGIITFTVIVVLLSLGFGLLPAFLLGVPVTAFTLLVAGVLARFERARLAVYLGEFIPSPDPAGAEGVGWLRATLRSGLRWRATLYMVLLLPMSGVGFSLVVAFWSAGLVGLSLPVWESLLPAGASSIFGDMGAARRLVPAAAIGAAALMIAPWVTRGWAGLSAWLARSLLGPSQGEKLSLRVGELETTRTRVVDAADAERRRIERDLHDGAQQRLVALAVDLGRVRGKLEADPSASAEATAMVVAAHEEAKRALTELRDLVRGIHPAVLADRGLDAALSALAARCPIPVTVASDLGARGRCSPSAEAVAYFVVAESLTNVAKHAAATRAAVTAQLEDGQLLVSVTDDGRGGANPGGAGLRGLADRAAALDGSLAVGSPVGGPTTITVRLPCE
jgi:signal transduction histidine kinase